MARPDRVFLTIAATAATVSTLAFTISPLYRIQVAGLDNLELVLAGTVMEACVFCFEIPTGIVADLWSRKWSVIIGHLGIGIGFLVEASFPTVAGVLAGQAIWGIAYTFTSGATVAWVSGELDDPDRRQLTRLFLRASRFGSAAALVAVPLSFVLGLGWTLRAPLVLGAVVSVALALWLVVAMGERHFEPSPERSAWRAMAATARSGVGAIRASRVLLILALALFISGGASEAYDRYTDRLLLDLGPPGWSDWSAVRWIAVVGCTSAALGIVVPWWFQRAHGQLSEDGQRHWIAGLILVQVTFLLVMAASGSFLMAAAASLVIDRVRSLRSSLLGGWIVPLTPRRHRATVLSTLEQADSISQVTIGPVMGVIGNTAGVPAALATSAVLLAPSAGAVLLARREVDTAPPAPAKISG
jgi:DHA3 family tetracycline resistance protein-like MFS transporter